MVTSVFYRKTLQGFVTLMQGYHCVLTTFKIRDIPFPTHFGHYIELLLRSLMIDQMAKANFYNIQDAGIMSKEEMDINTITG
jgi:hypothetical protein